MGRHRAWSKYLEVRGQRSEVRSQRIDYRWFKVLNIERQNKEPQNDEVVTSIFEIPCSIFCGLKTNDSGPKSEVGGRRTDNESWGSIVIRSLSFVVTGHGVERCGRSGDPRGTEKEGLSNVH